MIISLPRKVCEGTIGDTAYRVGLRTSVDDVEVNALYFAIVADLTAYSQEVPLVGNNFLQLL